MVEEGVEVGNVYECQEDGDCQSFYCFDRGVCVVYGAQEPCGAGPAAWSGYLGASDLRGR